MSEEVSAKFCSLCGWGMSQDEKDNLLAGQSHYCRAKHQWIAGSDELRQARLYAALSRAVKQAEAVEKDATNAFHKYKYASAEAIIAEARAALSAQGLAVFPVSVGRDPEQVNHVWIGEGEAVSIDVPRRILAVYRLVHESGESIEFSSTCPVIPERGRPEDKAEFGARTENLGYMLRDLLCLPRVAEGTPLPSGRDDTNSAPRPPRNPPRAEVPKGEAQRTPPQSVAAGTIGEPSKLKRLTDGIDTAVKLKSMAALTGLYGQVAEWPDKEERLGLKNAYLAAKSTIEHDTKATP